MIFPYPGDQRFEHIDGLGSKKQSYFFGKENYWKMRRILISYCICI